MILANVTLKDITNNKRVGMVYMVTDNIDEGLSNVIKEFCAKNKMIEKNIRAISISILASDTEGDRQLIISLSK